MKTPHPPFRAALWVLVALVAVASTNESFLSTTRFANALSLSRRPPTSALRSTRSSKSLRWAVSSSASDNDESAPRKNEKQQSTASPSETATIPEEVFNLVKSIIGAGVLSLPAGIALMATTAGSGLVSSRPGTVLFSSSFLIALMGSISAYTFSLIARVCKMTDSDTYAECWKATKGQSLAWIVALSSTLDCLAGNLTYSMVLADTFRQLLFSLLRVVGSGGKFAAALEASNSRTNVLLLLTTTVLLPLCCVQNLSSLAPFSLVGILGMVYTGVVIGVRYFDGSYMLPNGRFLADLKSLPSTGTTADGASSFPLLNPQSLILVSMLSTAYIAHFNAPKFFKELKGASDRPKRFHLGVVIPSFAACVLFYSLVSSLGYLTFGSATAPMILSNYSTKDLLVSLSRFAVGLSLIFSYPLLFVGFREGIVDLINQVSPLLRKTKQQKAPLVLTRSQSNQVTVGLVSFITVLALKITDLTFVASMSGALLGTSLIFIFPTLMFRSALKQQSEKTNKPYTKLQTFERTLCSVIAGLGVFIAGVGARMAWKASGGA
mmetsp:Transcript_12543/g.35610  ORF Transcript_12543/g.35610 Transcript_12543/m.35610 type:complete len:550 (+) Transcript_12543:305-1954(+)